MRWPSSKRATRPRRTTSCKPSRTAAAARWRSRPDADATEVATAIVEIVGTAHGKRPFRVHIDAADDGAALVNAVADRIRAEILTRTGLDDFLHPARIA
jgi:hypothetical protein